MGSGDPGNLEVTTSVKSLGTSQIEMGDPCTKDGPGGPTISLERGRYVSRPTTVMLPRLSTETLLVSRVCEV